MRNRLVHAFLASFLISWLTLPRLWAEEEPEEPRRDLRKLMGEDRFVEAGLEKLSKEELAVLEIWLKDRIRSETEVAAEIAVEEKREEIRSLVEGAFGFLPFWDRGESIPEELRGPDSIESVIPGSFTGWRGNTRFELANGQLWEQVGQDRYYMPLEDPRVRIEQGLLGSHYLRIIDTGRRVKVRRIR